MGAQENGFKNGNDITFNTGRGVHSAVCGAADAERLDMKTSTKTLSAALRVLALEIQSADGIANAAIAEAAERLEEQEALSRNLYEFMHEAVRHCWMGKSWTPQQIREKGVELGLMVKKGKYVYAYSDELKKHFG